MKTLKELSIEKPYYCATGNYFSNEVNGEFDTMTDFLAEFKDADIDMNYMFRFDIKPRDDENTETGREYAEIFLMLQRKGIFKPCYVKHINEEEAIQFSEYAKKHWEYTQKLWSPLSKK